MKMRLMLSLLYESKVEQAAILRQPQFRPSVAVPARAVSSQQAAPEFNLETSQTRALQNNQQSHFHLLHSLYAECSIPVDPVLQTVQQSNGAQFALMLSLLYESKVEQAAILRQPQFRPSVAVPARAVSSQQAAPEFNLETSQTRALQNNQQSHFHLLHSLYAECSIPVDPVLQTSAADNAAITDNVLQEIAQGQGNATVTREAEKISFASPAQAA